MTHFRRLATEQVMQAASISLSMIDRLFLTGLLYRFWGTEKFEVWSVCVALAGLCSLCELGFNMYFANRLMFETEGNHPNEARRTLYLANTVFACCALLALVVSIGTATFSGHTLGDPYAAVIIVLLSASIALRLAYSGVFAIYRAHRQFALYTRTSLIFETVRIALVMLTALSGAGLLAAAVATLLSVAFQIGWVSKDVRQRFNIGVFGWSLPSTGDVREILIPSMAYFAQMIPLILLTHIPVLLVNQAAAAPALLAQFVLMRTLGGLPRALLQALGVVSGQECARRIAVADVDGASEMLLSSLRAFAALSGLAAGFLLACGPTIVEVWTSDKAVFRQDYLTAALLPMLLTAASVISHNLLSASNSPYHAAAGRMAQLAITLAAAFFAPISDAGMRLLIALSAGEILGFAPLSYYGVAKAIPKTGIAVHAATIALTLVSALLAFMLARGFLMLAGDTAGMFSRAAAIGLAGLLLIPMFALLGLPSDVRNKLSNRLTKRRASPPSGEA